LREAWIKVPLLAPKEEVACHHNETSNNTLRVMTYNLLADLYAARDVDQQIMYNHCPTKFLHKERRMPMILYELLVFKPDVICLQEVDASIFTYLFRPCLESQGYQGYYSNKASAQLEGCAMFWSLDCFHRIYDADMHEYYLKDVFKEHKHSYDCWESLNDIDRLLQENAELSRITKEKIGQVLQVAELRLKHPGEDKPERMLVGNTHLFYHPLADHIRTIQAYMVCHQMEMIRHRHGLPPCPLLFCGDLNSGPLSGAVQLLLQRKVGPENHDTWKHLHDYHWEMGDAEFLLEHGYIGNYSNSSGEGPIYEDEAFEDALESFEDEESDSANTEEVVSPPPLIHLPSVFPNLVSGYPDIPEFTNYAVDFAETLDYILISEPSLTAPFGLLPLRAAPVPTTHTMKNFIAMPNENMPSDHLSLLCDLEWKHYSTQAGNSKSFRSSSDHSII
jgi:mRNA deadenylase 3'-5' endonuclease subunit Ccr4